MAAGTVTIITNYVQTMANMTPADKWGSDTIKVALITTSTTPSKTDSNPCYGAGGAQNYATNEIANAGAYTTGGVTLAGCTVTQSSNLVNLNATSPIDWAANGASPANASGAIIYDRTTANKEVLGFIDLGGVTSLVPGLQINLNGVSSGTQIVFQATT
jgi:hypothetical protein